jgi:hypothetical protein
LSRRIFVLSCYLSTKILLFLFPCRTQRAENALKYYRGFASDVGDMNGKLKLEYDNMTCMIKMANSDLTRGKITPGDFRNFDENFFSPSVEA